MSDEYRLVEEVKAGSESAFTGIVRLHQARVRAYLGRIVADTGVVDDLAQEVFFTAYRSIDTWQGDAPLGTWLVGIARNRALTYLRGERRRQQRNAALHAALAGWRAEKVEEEKPRDDRTMAALSACIQSLPGRSRSLFDAHYREGQSAVALSRRMGKADGILRMTLRRIRLALRRCIEEKMAVQEP